MQFPESCVLYLRSTRNTPDKLMIKLLLPGGREAVYETPVVKIKTYSKEEIFQKRLLLFIPFYILRYESAIKRNRNKALEKMYGELEEILAMLEKAKKTTGENGIYSLIEESFQKINNYISETNQKCKERIEEIMRGNTLELETIKNWDEGHAVGIQEGISEGIPLGEARQLVRSVDNMVEKHNLSFEEACNYVGVTIQQYKAAKELVGVEKHI